MAAATRDGTSGTGLPPAMGEMPEWAGNVAMAVLPVPLGKVELGAKLAVGAAKAISLPAWRHVTVNFVHILERHVPGAKYAAGRTVFPSTMNEKGIMRAIRSAYESGTKVGMQGSERVLLQGQGSGLTIEMWFNRATNTIETAFPVAL